MRVAGSWRSETMADKPKPQDPARGGKPEVEARVDQLFRDLLKIRWPMTPDIDPGTEKRRPARKDKEG